MNGVTNNGLYSAIVGDTANNAAKVLLRTKTYTIDPRNYVEYRSFEGNYLWEFNVHNSCRDPTFNT